MRDIRGLEVTVAGEDALAAYEQAVAGYVGHRRDTMEALDAALAADPDFILAHCLKGYLLKLATDPAFDARAAEHSVAASRAAPRGTARERAHAAALDAWIGGDMAAVRRAWEDILLDAPRDLATIKLLQFHHFWRGEADGMRDTVARTLHAWSPDVPGHPFVLGMLAFGFEECGDYAASERTGREAAERDPADAWAIHAVAHTLEMQGRTADGIAWLTETEPGWAPCNNFAYHLWWHRALYHLERGETDAVFDLYDSGIRADRTEFAPDLANGTALLWRLELLGVDVGDRWDELAVRSAAHARDAASPFFETQYVMALAATGRAADTAAVLETLRGAMPRDDAHAIRAAEVALALAEAMVAFRAGDWDGCVDRMLPVRYEAVLIGGSHAQRDVFDQTLVTAALRGSRPALARALVAERKARHRGVPDAWSRAVH
jgi:hypothetical protein